MDWHMRANGSGLERFICHETASLDSTDIYISTSRGEHKYYSPTPHPSLFSSWLCPCFSLRTDSQQNPYVQSEVIT